MVVATRYEIETTVTSVRNESRIRRGWKNADGTSEYEYDPERWIVSTGSGLTFACENQPGFDAGCPVKLIVDVG